MRLVSVLLMSASVLVPQTARGQAASKTMELALPSETDRAQLISLAKQPAATTSVSELQPGKIRAGQLEATDPAFHDGRRFDVWRYSGRQGERLTVEMDSNAFDASLAVLAPSADSLALLSADDDGAQGTNARVITTLPRNAVYTILATSYAPGGLGEYHIYTRDWTKLYPGGGDPKERYALLVGINDYPGEDKDLHSSVEDAKTMREILINQFGFSPDNIVFLRNGGAYRENILQGFMRHLGQAGPDGVAVFYYSGHGTQLDGNEFLQDLEPDGVDEALAVWGTEDYPDAKSSYILDDELGLLASALSTKRVLFILDACYSGTGTRALPDEDLVAKWVSFNELDPLRPASYFGAPQIAEGQPASVPEPDHILLAASADSEVSWSISPGNTSAFTYFLVRELSGEGKQSSFAEMMERVRDKVIDFTANYPNPEVTRQSPQLEGTNTGISIEEYLRRR